jgi:PIN domain nuclease of toxin-antitoxin system
MLDASAVLALLHAESGADAVYQAMTSGQCGISSVNLAEVAARLSDRGVPPEVVQESLASLGLETLDFRLPHALRSGTLRSMTRASGLSLGDRACLATAEIEGAGVLTADRAWAALDLGLDIRVIR